MWSGMHEVLLGLAAAGPVTAELLDEGGCFEPRGGWYKEFTGGSQRLAIDKLCRR